MDFGSYSPYLFGNAFFGLWGSVCKPRGGFVGKICARIMDWVAGRFIEVN